MKELLLAAVLFLTELIHGFALIFLTLFIAVNIFGRKFRQGKLIPAIAGIALAAVTLFFYIHSGAVDLTLCLFLIVPPSAAALWLLYTDRSAASLVSLIFAMTFTDSIISATGNIIYAATSYFIPGKSIVIELTGMILIYTLSILYMKLLHLLSGGTPREPLSLPNTALICIPVMLLTSSDRSSYMFSDQTEAADISQVVISSVILLCISLFVVFMIKSNQTKYLEKVNHLNEEYLNIQSHHFEMAKKNDMAMRKLNHDMRNHIFCLNELYRSGKYDELGKYLDDMNKAVSNAQPAVKTGSGIADAIIMEKAATAEKYNVELKACGTFSSVNISPYELCTILANLLDNAVEAASYFCVKHRWIEVSCRTSGNFIVITVRNVTAEAVDVSSPIRTIKREKKAHGFGLGNVRTAAQKAGGDLMLSCEPYDPGNSSCRS